MRQSSRPSSLINLALSTQNREAALLRATTDLFVHGGPHDRDEIRRFEELATHFIPKVLVSDRAYVAESLAERADSPPSVLVLLGKDLVEVAAPVLKRARSLSGADLLEIIAATGPLHHRMIAGRGELPAEVVEALRVREDALTVALLDRPALLKPVAEAIAKQVVQPIRQAPVAVEEPEWESELEPAEEAETLAATNRRGEIIEADFEFDFHLDAASFSIPPPTGSDVDNIVDNIHQAADRFLRLDRAGRTSMLAAFSEDRIAAPRRPARQQFDFALRAAQKSAQIPELARSKQKEALITAFAEGLELEVDLVRRLVDDPSGEPLVLLIKAIGLPEPDARQVLLLANPAIGIAVDTFFRLSDLHAAMEPGIAEAMVSAWRGESPAVAPKYMPQFADAEGVRRRAAQAPGAKIQREAEFLRKREG